jgi:phosphocarrier protein
VSAAGEAQAGWLTRTVAICNKKGLHARASVRFVDRASRFNADIRVSRDGTSVPATSIMGLMMLAAPLGARIEIAASGPEAAQALDALVALVQAKFDEE